MKILHIIALASVGFLIFGNAPEKLRDTSKESPADARVKLFINGSTNFVDESDLDSCSPDLREKAWEKLD
jgi:hypothetical protein